MDLTAERLDLADPFQRRWYLRQVLSHGRDTAEEKALSAEEEGVANSVESGYGTRQSTRDVDTVILAPRDARTIRDLAKIVAAERGWPEDWLNDAAKGYLVGLSSGPVIFTAPGIEVRSPSVAQLLAMKLSAWPDDVDIADARRLLQELGKGEGREATWESVQAFLSSGQRTQGAIRVSGFVGELVW